MSELQEELDKCKTERDGAKKFREEMKAEIMELPHRMALMEIMMDGLTLKLSGYEGLTADEFRRQLASNGSS